MTMRRKSQTVFTQHALLVAWGAYAQQIELSQKLAQVSLRQKTYRHSPQGKVLELMIATLAGLAYLEDISRSAHPLDQDHAVAQAWGQAGWADYSGVSRTLQKLTLPEARQIVQVLQEINQGFLTSEIELALQQSGYLVFDGDLTGLEVSKSSTTYPNVAYGHMDDKVCLGYQAAIVSLSSPTYGRLWVSVEHHPGNAVSATQAQALVQAAEACTGLRPLRRTELLEQRLTRLAQEEHTWYVRLSAHRIKLEQVQEYLAKTIHTLQTLQTRVSELETDYQTRQCPERPVSRLAKARQRLASYQARLLRSQKAVAQAQGLVAWSQERLADCQAEQKRLQERLSRFQQDNLTNARPMQAVFRLDAGFGTWENLALLIEMGYEVLTKAYSPQTTQHFCKQIPENPQWFPVGTQAEMLTWENYTWKAFWYPLDVGLARFTDGDRVTHCTLLHFGPQPLAKNAHQWFRLYNDRQIIEAGIKETRQVFYLHRLKVRTEAAIFLQEYFVLFAANFIRWANRWLKQVGSGNAKPNLDLTKIGMKRFVQVATHTSASVTWSSAGCLLKFSDLSCMAGKQLFLPACASPSKVKPNKIVFFQRFERFALWLHKT
jgi:hypothetical protein